jgi:hypothetical protein
MFNAHGALGSYDRVKPQEVGVSEEQGHLDKAR